MELKYAANICQRTTNAIYFILLQIGIVILNNLNDLADAEQKENVFCISLFRCKNEVSRRL